MKLALVTCLVFLALFQSVVADPIAVLIQLATTISQPGLERLSRILGLGDKDKTCGDSHQVVFYEGNECTQNTVGSVGTQNIRGNSCPGQDVRQLECFDNDEARSVLILPGFPENGIIWVCDNPSNCLNDDYATIEVKKQVGDDRTGICVTTFEESFENENVKVSFNRVNGLDGKVSRAMACSRP